MRKLTLTKEVLAELSSEEMSAVVGATAGDLKTKLCATDPCITPPVSRLRCTFSLGPDVCGG